MHTMLRVLRFQFLGPLPDLAILVLRVWLGLTMLLNHGLEKLLNFHDKMSGFPDPLGLGGPLSLGLAVFAEVIGAALVAAGCFTRLGALVLSVNMAVAFLIVHQGVLAMGTDSGELAFIYLAGFATVFLSGAGRWSFDQMAFARGVAGAPH